MSAPPAPSAPGGRDDRGYTLVELMVVVTLLGALLAIGVGGFRQYGEARAQSGAADEVREALRQAQQRAVTGGTSTCVEFEDTTYRVFAGACDSGGTREQLAADDLENGVRFAEPRFATGPGTSSTGLTFRARGTASPGSVQLLRGGSDTVRLVEVEGLTGRVTVD